MKPNEIHPTALIAEGAIIGTGNVIGPYAVIGASVVLGDANWVGAGTSLGAPPEVRGAELEPFGERPHRDIGRLIVGDRNVIREQVTIGRGWASSTWIGDDCYIMAGSYIAHDCAIGAESTVSSGVRMAGHVHVGPFANLGMGVTVHQRRTIGPAAMVGMSAVVTRDLPAFSKAYGSPARVHGQNVYLLQKFGLSAADGSRLAELLGPGDASGAGAGADAAADARAEAISPALWPVIRAWRSAPGPLGSPLP